jgi:hypothetical protein
MADSPDIRVDTLETRICIAGFDAENLSSDYRLGTTSSFSREVDWEEISHRREVLLAQNLAIRRSFAAIGVITHVRGISNGSLRLFMVPPPRVPNI